MKNKFVNESTYKGFLESNREGEFDEKFDEAVTASLNSFGKAHPMYIGGKAEYAKELIEEKSPINSITIGTFQKGDETHARLAVSAASNAFAAWSGTDYMERAAIFRKAAKLLSERKFVTAAILSYENGKSRFESMGEVDEAIDFMKYYADDIESNRGYVRKNSIEPSGKLAELGFQGAPSPGEKIKISLKPYGVFGVIAPFNFPVSISIGMSTGALITGNTVVFKPSSTDNMTMLTGLKIWELFRDAGVPPGAFNYITGPGDVVGHELMSNDGVSGIAFTGSKSTGLGMMAECFGSGKHKAFIVEMGGKNPVIITKYADLDLAVSGVASAAFGFCGQKCSALSRVYVHKAVKEQFIGKLIDKVREFKIGDPLDKEVYIGPLISQSAYKRFESVVASARTNARILYGGNRVRNGIADSYYVEPTIIEIKHDNELARRELFLPVLTIEEFTNLDNAINMANDTEYGLTAGFYSRNAKEVKKFTNGILAGVVYVNRGISATTGAIVGMHTFVGWKGSGLTGKGSGSRFYLQQFMREQSISVTK